MLLKYGLRVGTGDNDGAKEGTRDTAIDGSEDTSRLDGFEVGIADGSRVPQRVHVSGQSCQRL